MNIIVAMPGYRPIHKLVHWNHSQLQTCPEPKFFESRRKPMAAIDVARSIIATDLLNEKEFEALLFLDDDIIFNPKDMVKLSQHIKDGKSVVGAAYATRSDKPRLACRLFDGQTVEFSSGSKPVKIKYLAGGCVMVHRTVFEKLREKLTYCNFSEVAFWPFFMPFVKYERSGIFKRTANYMTEDYAFMDRCLDSGIDVWLDPSIRLEHVGEKMNKLEDIVNPLVQDKMEKIVLTETGNLKNGKSRDESKLIPSV